MHFYASPILLSNPYELCKDRLIFSSSIFSGKVSTNELKMWKFSKKGENDLNLTQNVSGVKPKENAEKLNFWFSIEECDETIWNFEPIVLNPVDGNLIVCVFLCFTCFEEILELYGRFSQKGIGISSSIESSRKSVRIGPSLGKSSKFRRIWGTVREFISNTWNGRM